MEKNLSMINPNVINLSQHTRFVSVGTVYYKVQDGDFNPLNATGQEGRCSKNLNGLSPQKYQEFSSIGMGAKVGTGAVYVAESLPTAFIEARQSTKRSYNNLKAYKIIVQDSIAFVDSDSICESEGVGKPYTRPNKREEYFHGFYGLRVKAFRYQSAQDPSGHCVVLFPDNIPSYPKGFDYKECSKEEIMGALATINASTV